MSKNAGGKSGRRERGLVLLGLPAFLFLTTTAVFLGAASRLGKEAGYLLGFLFYWLFWCLFFPRFMLGKAGFSQVLTDRSPLFARRNWPAAALLAIVTGVTAILYLSHFVRAPWALILLALPCASANGLCEEILWRGLYVKSFPGNRWLAIVYPSVGFAAWHFVPQMVFPAATGTLAFVAAAFLLGLAYGFVAYRTGSARWTAISHSLNGTLALGGHVAISILSLV